MRYVTIPTASTKQIPKCGLKNMQIRSEQRLISQYTVNLVFKLQLFVCRAIQTLEMWNIYVALCTFQKPTSSSKCTRQISNMNIFCQFFFTLSVTLHERLWNDCSAKAARGETTVHCSCGPWTQPASADRTASFQEKLPRCQVFLAIQFLRHVYLLLL